MKKSVVMLILVIYVASVAVIGVFGMKSVLYDEKIYIEKITCINEEAKDAEVTIDGRTLTIQKVVIDYKESEETTFWIQWRVFPEDASFRRVEFVSGNENVATVDGQGIVRFIKKGTVTIYINALDGSKIQGIVKITAWKFN